MAASSPSTYSITRPSGITSGLGEPIAALWNPHASKALYVKSVQASMRLSISTGITVRLSRITTRGTTAQTNTPQADVHYGRRAGPASGAILDSGDYSAAATEAAPPLLHAVLAEPGSEIEWWLPDPIVVPAGTGLAVFGHVATTNSVVVAFVWEE